MTIIYPFRCEFMLIGHGKGYIIPFYLLCSFLGKRVLSDAWALDTAQKPYAWQRLNPEGDRPSARM